MSRRPAPPRPRAPQAAPAPSPRPPASRGAASRPLRSSVPAPSSPGARPHPVVTVTSVRRFAARARTARWVRRRPLLLGVAGLALVAGLGWAALCSPVLALRQVEVVGTVRLPADQVSSVAADELGTPLPRVDVAALAREVEALAMVRRVEVVRSWPRSIQIRVEERVPLAAVPAQGGFAVLDADGVVVAETAQPPVDVPLVEVDVARAGAAALRAATAVVRALPEDLRSQVARAGAASADSVVLDLRSGAQVRWGSADEPAAKAAALRALLSVPAARYDVSAPAVPALG